MSDNEREKNAAIIREVVKQADTDGLDRFMSQYSRAAVAEWLIAEMPVDARRNFLQHQLATYAGFARERPESPCFRFACGDASGFLRRARRAGKGSGL